MSSNYWSSTTNANNPNNAWYVDFSSGYVDGDDRSYYGYVRAVRSGQCGLFDTSTTTIVASTSTTTVGPIPTTSIEGSTTTITIPTCPTEILYGEDSEETELLRSLRDNVLNQTSEGQEIIKLYYQWSPVIVEVMEEDEAFKAQMKGMIDGVLIMLE